MRLTRPLLVCALLAAGSTAIGDIVLHVREGMIDGQIRPVESDESQVEVNEFWSKHPKATFGTKRVAKELVKKQVVQKRPQEEYHDQALALKPDDAAGHVALAQWCKKTRRKHEMLYHAELALIADPANADAAKLYGKGKVKKFLAQHEEYTTQVVPILKELLAIDPKAEDKDDQIAAIKERLEAFKSAPNDLTVDRLYRSQQARRGLFKVQGRGNDSGIDHVGPLKMRMDVGGLRRSNFALFVPKDYDPLKTYPLIMGLHGGGPGPNPEDDPVGSGSSTITFYIPDATSRGYIVVCPDAITAGWGGSENDEFIEKLFREMVLTYNVDLRRVYIMGHSMGGFGSWRQGPRLCDHIAAFSPNSGAACNNVSKLVKTKTAVYFYHGDDDNRCAVGPARSAAQQLKKAGADFIYTELAGTGHSWPRECISQSFDLFDRRRTFPTGAKMIFAHPQTRGFKLPPGIAPVSSLEVLPLSKPEVTDLGGIDTGKKKKAKPGSEWKALVTQLTKGGEMGDEAAKQIAGHPDKAKMTKAVIGLLNHEQQDTRRVAATALGNIGDPKALKPLGNAATEEKREVRRAAVAAIGKFAAVDAGATIEQLKKALKWQRDWFDKVTPSDRMRADNWQWNLQELKIIFTAAEPVADAEFLGLVKSICVEGMALRTLEIPWDRVAHTDPKITRERHAVAIAEFAGKAGGKHTAEAEAILAAIESDSRFSDVAGIKRAVADARAALK